MRAPIRATVLSPLILFQPNTWGFLAGKDFGLAWLWWVLFFGVFFSSFFLFREISEGNNFLSVCGGLLIVFSPYFQLWSFHKAEIYIGACLSILFVLKMLTAKELQEKFGWSMAFGWAMGLFAFAMIYPPLQVTMMWAAIFMTLAFIVRRKDLSLKNLLWILPSLLVVASAGFLFLKELGPSLKILNETEYPGQRFSVGGDIPLWSYFVNHFFFRHWITDYGILGNICESGHAFFFFPALFTYFFLKDIKNKKLDLFAWTQLIFGVFVSYYSVVGIPPWLSEATLFSRSTSNRSGMALLFIDVSLLIYALHFKKEERSLGPLWLQILPALAFGGLLFFFGTQFKKEIPGLPLPLALFSSLLFPLLFYVLIETPFSKKGLIGFIFLSFFYTMSFNPIVRGGSNYLYTNPLSQKIRDLKRENPDARWIMYGISGGGELLKMMGVPALGGFQGIPNLAMWRILDRSGQNFSHYNRSGYIYFIPAAEEHPAFHAEQSVLLVNINPKDEGLRALNVQFILASKQTAKYLEKVGVGEKLLEYGNFSIFGIQQSTLAKN